MSWQKYILLWNSCGFLPRPALAFGWSRRSAFGRWRISLLLFLIPLYINGLLGNLCYSSSKQGGISTPICVPPMRFTGTKIFVVWNQYSKSLPGNWEELRLFWESHCFKAEWSIACLYMPFPLLLYSSDSCGVHGSSKVSCWELILSQTSVCKRVRSICQPLGLVKVEGSHDHLSLGSLVDLGVWKESNEEDLKQFFTKAHCSITHGVLEKSF